MPTRSEVIGWVLEGDREEKVLVRDEDGHVLAQANDPASDFTAFAIQTGAFRRARRIIDPLTKELLGYEMDCLPSRAAALA
jgi:hypothetical protein